MIIYLPPAKDGGSSDLPFRFTAGPAFLKPCHQDKALAAESIWSCSGRGLPCSRRCRRDGELLPRHFTLTPPKAGRYIFCGTFLRVAPSRR